MSGNYHFFSWNPVIGVKKLMFVFFVQTVCVRGMSLASNRQTSEGKT